MKRRKGSVSFFGVALLGAAMLHSCVGGLPPSLERDIRDERAVGCSDCVPSARLCPIEQTRALCASLCVQSSSFSI